MIENISEILNNSTIGQVGAIFTVLALLELISPLKVIHFIPNRPEFDWEPPCEKESWPEVRIFLCIICSTLMTGAMMYLSFDFEENKFNPIIFGFFAFVLGFNPSRNCWEIVAGMNPSSDFAGSGKFYFRRGALSLFVFSLLSILAIVVVSYEAQYIQVLNWVWFFWAALSLYIAWSTLVPLLTASIVIAFYLTLYSIFTNQRGVLNFLRWWLERSGINNHPISILVLIILITLHLVGIDLNIINLELFN